MKQDPTTLTEFEQTFASYRSLTLIGKGRDDVGRAVQRYIVYSNNANNFYITTCTPRAGLAAHQKMLDALVELCSCIEAHHEGLRSTRVLPLISLDRQTVMIGNVPAPFIISCEPLGIASACEGLRFAGDCGNHVDEKKK